MASINTPRSPEAQRVIGRLPSGARPTHEQWAEIVRADWEARIGEKPRFARKMLKKVAALPKSGA